MSIDQGAQVRACDSTQNTAVSELEYGNIKSVILNALIIAEIYITVQQVGGEGAWVVSSQCRFLKNT